MNNTQTMQMMADELNKAIEKHFPDYKWVVVKDPNMPDIIIDNIDSMCPNIHLVRKNGSSKGIDEISAGKILSATKDIDHINSNFLVLANGEYTVVIEAAKEYEKNREITPEYIKEIGANYGKNLEEIEGTWRSVQKIADPLNKIGKLHHLGYSFAVKEDAFSYDPMIDVVPSTIRSKVGSITKSDKTPSIMREELQKAFESADVHICNIGEHIIPIDIYKLDDKKIAEICFTYHNGIQGKLGKSSLTGVMYKENGKVNSR